MQTAGNFYLLGNSTPNPVFLDNSQGQFPDGSAVYPKLRFCASMLAGFQVERGASSVVSGDVCPKVDVVEIPRGRRLPDSGKKTIL